MGACIAIVFFLLIVPGWALDLVIKDGDTLTLDGTEFRLDGIDAPEKDQVCVDDKGALWACGIEARDHLAALIGERAVRCEDMGADIFYPKRRIGRCSVEGENMTLNQRLVREGWALSFEPYAKGRFKPDETDARDKRRGLWAGFAAPRDFRRWRKSSALFGTACPTDARNILFPDHPNMPPGCSIKGKVSLRAEIVGYRGITWRDVAVMLARKSRIVGSAPRRRRGPPDSANRTGVDKVRLQAKVFGRCLSEE
jgi:endonuclease YncB( thermonuclease family)